MPVRRTLRRLVALVAMLAVVTAQSVAVAYACTLGADMSAMAPVAAVPCPEHDASAAGGEASGQGNLCEVHCQSTPVPSPGAVAMAPPPGVVLVPAAHVALVAGVPARAPEAKGTPPPARSQYCRRQL